MIGPCTINGKGRLKEGVCRKQIEVIGNEQNTIIALRGGRLKVVPLFL